MDRQKGIAFCGLACALCSEAAHCVGCRDDGCADREWCTNLKCCRARRLNGCWECAEFPCSGTMLDKVRIRAFATFAREYGVEMLLDCLERNEQAGMVYHHPGKLTGDYDAAESEEGIMELILHGNAHREEPRDLAKAQNSNAGTLRPLNAKP